jgi:hypothetical protein
MSDPTPTPRRQLWRVMHDAYLKPNLSGPRGHLGFAAEIRALADWLVPEADAPTSGGDLAKMKHLVSMRFRAQLLDEADRAEAGE